jgi:hypothetical protein
MQGRGRIGVTAVLVAALMALGASPASAGGSKKAGVVGNGQTVTLLNTSGFVKIELTCDEDGNKNIVRTTPLTSSLHVWADFTHDSATVVGHDQSGNAVQSQSSSAEDLHLQWSASAGTKVAFGQIFVAAYSDATGNCAYTSQVS